ncbi:terminase large subunit domain-containing protein [Cupriavidus metallidurans]|uniref:terminase large subunit domain-containing protein n=1 Tax=Cupriavidus metallidurans TaxID=119219 RepID=UPI000CE05ED5|nr:terminase family protein [Cupriavidus metallidurans]AVA33354.1 terminase [Cupriavidus metallidurans]
MPSLNVPQSQFLELPHKFKAFVAGFGSGKTWVGCAGLCRHAWEFPRINAGYFAPTYGQIRDIFFPTIEEVAADWGLHAKVNASNKEVHLYAGRQYRGTIICRSMDKPGEIVGFKIGKGLIDELDVMRRDKAQIAWRKIIARMRQVSPGLLNGIDVTTTPEGFKFVYEQFVKAVRDKPELATLYGLVQASTYQNGKNLPDDYIPSLRASYPPQLIKAYLRGQFVNLTSGAVYPDFDRVKNHAPTVAIPGEPLLIGMDFNVTKMAAAVHVLRDGWPHAVQEFTGVRDTPEMARLLNGRFKGAGHPMTVYPDASGQNTSSKSASVSDLSILQQAGFTIRANSTNPAVKDRLNAVNALILNDKAERRYRVNTDACPVLTEALEQQVYDQNGEPDKTAGLDHITDAAGYPLAFRWPVAKPVTTHSRNLPHMGR